MGVDELGVDEMGVDEMGSSRSGTTTFETVKLPLFTSPRKLCNSSESMQERALLGVVSFRYFAVSI